MNELKPAFDKACSAIVVYLQNGVDKKDADHAKLLMSMIRSYISANNGKTNDNALKWSVNKAYAKNKEELRELITKNLPEYITV